MLTSFSSQSIFVPYFSFMLDQTTELLETFAKGESNDSTLWDAVASALTKALDHDENGMLKQFELFLVERD